jgi:uncharacterized protein (TIGR01777 family)
MRMVIAGGTGLIGRTLAQSLMEAGHEVIVLSRQPEKASGLLPGVAVERWDGTTAKGWGLLIEGADAVVNLAGENIAAGRWTAGRKRRIRESRLNAGRAIVEAIEAAKRRPQVLIQASGVGYYGDCGDQLLTEASEAGKDFLAQLAVEWEAGTAGVERLGVRRAVIRTGVVLSSEGGALPCMLLPFRFFVGGRMGGGKQWFPWIHISDEVNAIRFLIDREEAIGVFNLTAPNPVSNADFIRIMGRQLGRPSAVPIPAILLRIVFGEMADVLLFSERAVPQRLEDADYVFQFADIASALRDLLPRD